MGLLFSTHTYILRYRVSHFCAPSPLRISFNTKPETFPPSLGKLPVYFNQPVEGFEYFLNGPAKLVHFNFKSDAGVVYMPDLKGPHGKILRNYTILTRARKAQRSRIKTVIIDREQVCFQLS